VGWVSEHRSEELAALTGGRLGEMHIRKLFPSGLMVDAVAAQELARRRDHLGAQVGISSEAISGRGVVTFASQASS
jgi:hypothetical protein